MIVDTIINKSLYESLHPKFKSAFEYLLSINKLEIIDGKVELEGDDLFALISKNGTTSFNNQKLEAHKKYIDIHYVIEGTELFGQKFVSDCKSPSDEFNAEEDVIHYNDTDYNILKLTSGTFVIAFPGDAHVPCVTTNNLKKVVLKIKI